MRFSDKEIHEYIETSQLMVVGPRSDLPFDKYKQIQPCSIDLRLDSNFYEFRSDIDIFDIKNLDNVWDYADRYHVEDTQQIVINPNSIVFGQIYEQLRIPPDASGKIVGRSRFARLGLSVHATGDFINPEFEGAMPLQIINHNKFPIILYPYMTICQLILVRLTSDPIVPYPRKSNNPYHRERRVSPSVCHSDPAISDLPEENSINLEAEKRLVDNYLKQKEASEIINGLKINFEDEAIKKTSKVADTIVISGSTVGALNFGELVGNIKSGMMKLEGENDVPIKDVIGEMVTFVENEESDLDRENRQRATELIADITSIAAQPKTERPSQSTVMSMIKTLSDTVRTTASGSTLWQHWGNVLTTFFGG